MPQVFKIGSYWVLRNIMAIIEARSDEVIGKWKNFFGEARYFC